MLSSRFAGIPISSSIIDGRGVPQLRNRGEQTVRPSPAQVAGFKSEWWPGSNRNGGRLQIGIPGRIAIGIRTEGVLKPQAFLIRST